MEKHKKINQRHIFVFGAKEKKEIFIELRDCIAKLKNTITKYYYGVYKVTKH